MKKYILLFLGIISHICTHANLAFEKYIIEDVMYSSNHIYPFSFKFKNSGNSDISISSIDTSCGCVVLNGYKRTVSVGEKGTIDGKFYATGRQGPQRTSIIVKTNAVIGSRIDLLLKIRIKNPINFSSRILHWKKDVEYNPKTITITSDQGYHVSIECIKYDTKNLKIESNQINSEKIEITITPKNLIKDQKEYIKVKLKENNNILRTYLIYVLLK